MVYCDNLDLECSLKAHVLMAWFPDGGAMGR
jgi:hypothetical protein